MILKKVIPQLLLATVVLFAQKQKTVKPGFNMFSVEQDIQLGKEAAAQIERQMQVVNEPRMSALVQRIGSKLVAATDENQRFPFSFKVVNDPGINAFALPGGPMFINSGLIAAADNEAQVAGVMGHEMAHVILRHGTNQASKANLIQLPAALAAGIFDQGGVLGALTQMGIGLGANSLLLKYSRNAESDADLLGARLLSKAGYNPVELARFFEKLEAEGGKRGAVQQFFASHPNPGNRVQNIQQDMRFYPKRNYTTGENSAEFQAAKTAARSMPKPTQRQGALSVPSGGRAPETQAPSGFKVLRSPLYAIAHPDDWRAELGQDQVSATLTPQDGAIQGADGQSDIGHGVLITMSQAQSKDIATETKSYIQSLLQGNQGVRQVGNSQRIQVNNYVAMQTALEGQSKLRRGEKEIIRVLTVMHPQGLFRAIMIAPEGRWNIAGREYEQMINSIRF